MLPPWVSHSLRDLSSLLPSVSSVLLGDELVPASLPGDSASRTVPQRSLSAKAQLGCSDPGHRSPHHPRVVCVCVCMFQPDSLCRLLFSSLSASSSWMKGMPSMRRNTDSLGLRSPSERLPAGTQGRHGSRAGRTQGDASCRSRSQCQGSPGSTSTQGTGIYVPAHLHLCACAGTEQHPQVCVRKCPHASVHVQLHLSSGMTVMPVGPSTASPGGTQCWPMAGKGCCWMTYT